MKLKRLKPISLLIASLLLALPAIANVNLNGNGLNSASVLGIRTGVYRGSGQLDSQSALMPSLKFKSVRVLANGLIFIKTSASLAGVEVSRAAMKLKVQPISENRFELLDISNADAVSGSGYCESGRCTFSVTTMKGSLILTETWVPKDGGFMIVNASQTHNGKSATYSATFTKAK